MALRSGKGAHVSLNDGGGVRNSIGTFNPRHARLHPPTVPSDRLQSALFSDESTCTAGNRTAVLAGTRNPVLEVDPQDSTAASEVKVQLCPLDVSEHPKRTHQVEAGTCRRPMMASAEVSLPCLARASSIRLPLRAVAKRIPTHTTFPPPPSMTGPW